MIISTGYEELDQNRPPPARIRTIHSHLGRVPQGRFFTWT